MTDELEASKIKIRRDTTENWNDHNPVLDAGEIGIEWTDEATGACKIKIGNGILTFRELPYFSGYNIPYENLVSSTLPKINGVKVKGSLSLSELGIQPRGNYAPTTYVDNKLALKANIDEVYSREYLDDKFSTFSKTQVPSIDENKGKYLKVIEDNDELTMAWTDIKSEDVVTPESLEETLEGYVDKREGYSLVEDEEYDNLVSNINTIIGYNLPDVIDDVENLNELIETKVSRSELGTYIDDEKLSKVLTGDYTGDTPYSEYGYASKEDIAGKASQEDLVAHTEAIYDADVAEEFKTTNPHGITLNMFGMNQEEYSKYYNPDDLPISRLTQLAIDGKQDKFTVGYGLQLTNGELKNQLPNIKSNWLSPASANDGILNKPSNQQFQADWAITDTNALGYIRHKPEIKDYILPVAQKEELGGIKLGNDFEVDEDGHLKYVSGIEDYDKLTNKPSFLVAKRDEETGEIIPDEYDEIELISGMIPSDLNLASLSVAKAIDERLEEEKADKEDLEALREYVESAIPSIGSTYSKTEADAKFVNKTDFATSMATKADKDNVYAKSETYSKDYIDNEFGIVDARLDDVEENKEEKIHKTQTIHGLIGDELETKYTSAGAVKEVYDAVEKLSNKTHNINNVPANELETKYTSAKAVKDAVTDVLDELHTDYYTKPEVDTLISSVYKYKGTVQTYSELPTQDNVEGDVWNVIQADTEHGIKAGDNVAWVSDSGATGHWDVLSGITDLSNYYTKAESDNRFVNKTTYENKIDEIEGNIDDMGSEVEAALETKADKANTLAGYNIGDAYTKVDTEVLINNAVNNKAEQIEVDAITAPAVYRGTVATYDNLPSSGLNVNDLYVVANTREYYVWDGTDWVKQVPLGDKADKSTTYTKDEIDANYATIQFANTKASLTDFNNHVNNLANPHAVTKTQVGLGNVDNTSDANKPISNATQVALNNKQNTLTPNQLAAANSGVTAARVETYETAVTTIPTLATKTALAEVKQTADNAATTLLSKANSADVYTKLEIDAKIAAGMHYKGTVATVAALDNIQNPSVGDMYNVHSTGANYAWNGSSWDKMSEFIDLEDIYTKEEVDDIADGIETSIEEVEAQLQNKQDTLTAGSNITITNNVISANVSGTLATKLSELQNDTGFITISDVPAINNGILTIQKNGADIGTFTANSATDNSINITVPTRVADLSDGNTYVKSSTLATVATSGDYNDLLNQPTIGNGILTIMRNGIAIDTFTANSTTDKTIDITVPTTVASLSDASNYQATLVSGTNIKTVNNQSLLGSGNLDIDGLPTQSGNSGKFLTTNGTTASWATVDTSKVEWATYGTTTYAQIIEWFDAGKIVFCCYNQHIYMLVAVASSLYCEFQVYYNEGIQGRCLRVDTSNNWTFKNTILQERIPAGTAGQVVTYTGTAGTVGSASLPSIATTSVEGLVKPDGTTITVTNDGTISANSSTITFRTWSD